MSATASAPHAALSRLYATHHAWLQGWLRRRLGCAFDADDVAQDTFMRLLKSDAAATLREPKDFLVTVAKRVMVDLFRRRTLERAYLEMLTLIPEGYAPSPEQRQSLLESLQQIDAMLDGRGQKRNRPFCCRSSKAWAMRTSPCASACRSVRLKIHGQGHRALPAVQPGKRRFLMSNAITPSSARR